jgi:uncharacterized repeat protein (TIGR03803 family)
MKSLVSPSRLAIVVALALAAFAPAQAQTYSVRYSFQGGPTDGRAPEGELALDQLGNLYGTTFTGGSRGSGVLFKVDPLGNETILHNFEESTAHDGDGPRGGLLRIAGKMYGTTQGGGNGTDCSAITCGTVFEVIGGKEKVLATLDGSTQYPGVIGGLISDASGNFYGVSSLVNGDGIVFKLNQGQLSVLYTFRGTPDGLGPRGSLVIDSAGNLYGVTSGGGAFGAGTFYGGTVFELSPNSDGSWSEQILYSFTSGAGWAPTSLAMDLNGNLYGATQYGGRKMLSGCVGCGVVFKLKRNSDGSWSERVLHTFGGAGDGRQPVGAVVLDKHGNLYGACRASQPPGRGMIYKIDDTGNETILHTFTGADGGADPLAGLIMDASGNLYGTTSQGGNDTNGGNGIVFETTP